MLNIIAAGNLTKDANAREVISDKGNSFAVQFTIAINEKYGDKENATFLPCTYWTKSDKIVQYLTKGKAVILHIDWYSNTEKDGRYWQDFRVRKLEFQKGSTPSESATVKNSAQDLLDDEDDDLPF
ncbi:single-stranded DNA-binding protein [Cruoricaptor ignavus]|nr:single-stranded DNA-binding protein [Cruoricaptor ignavus]